MATSFTAEVTARVNAYQKRMEATFRGSAQDLAEEVTRPVAKGGHMRVKTGFLRSSMLASTTAMPTIRQGNRPSSSAPDNSFSPNEGQITITIANAKLSQTIFFGFTADYAAIREYYDGFVRLPAQNWQSIVNRNSSKAIRAFP